MKEELRRVLNPGASILGMSSVFELPDRKLSLPITAQKSDASDRNRNAQGFFRESERDDECGSGKKMSIAGQEDGDVFCETSDEEKGRKRRR